MSNFYVYADYRQNTDEPFYVGKGTMKRVRDMKRNQLHENIAKTHGVIRKIIYECETNEIACELEIRTIKELNTFHGDNPRGANFTRGGEGAPGMDQTAKREKMKLLRATESEETKTKRREKLSQTMTPERRSEVGRIIAERWNNLTDDEKAKRAEKSSLNRRNETQESREKRLAKSAETFTNEKRLIHKKNISLAYQAKTVQEKEEIAAKKSAAKLMRSEEEKQAWAEKVRETWRKKRQLKT